LNRTYIKILFILTLIFGGCSAFSAFEEEKKDSFPQELTRIDSLLIAREMTNMEEEFLVNGEFPEPIGGIEKIAERIVYPQEAIEAKVEGRLLLAIEVNENGEIEKIKILRSLSGGITSAAIEALKETKFTPGTLYGKAVKATTIIPLDFRLQ
jgi:TonB family protein